MEKEIVIKGLCKKYGRKKALDNVDLTIGKGMFGLLGRNGAGKTTLMKTLAGLLRKNGGSFTVCGIPDNDIKKIRAMTGYLPQEFAMYPSMTAEACLDYLGSLSGMKKQLRRDRIDMLLEKVNLSDSRSKKFKALSGGMKRRLGIAQALLHDPQVLIVDEPTAGLDPEERIRFRNLLSEVAGDRIVILSTHIVGDIESVCDRLAVLGEGKVIWNGSVSALEDDAKGKVWTLMTESRFIPQIKDMYNVTGMVRQGEYVQIRLVSDEKPDIAGVQPAEPGLEDAYIACITSGGIHYGGEE